MNKFYLLLILIFISCNKNEEYFSLYDVQMDVMDTTLFDFVLIAGQSNTCTGLGLDPVIDCKIPNTKQLGRFVENDYRIIDAIEPLDYWSKYKDRIGFVSTFAREYIKNKCSKKK